MARVEVKAVLENGEVKHYEYASVDLAIVALGKLAKVKVDDKQLSLPLAPKTEPTPAQIAATLRSPQDKPRRPRADKGVPRGPYSKGASETGLTQAEQEKAVHDAAVNKADDEARARMQAECDAKVSQQPDAGKPSADGGGPAAPAAAPVPSQEDVQKALEKLFEARGMDVSRAALSRLGVNRAQDLLPASRAQFIADAERLTNDKEARP